MNGTRNIFSPSESPPPTSTKTRKKPTPRKEKEKEPVPAAEYTGHFRDASIGLALIDTLDGWITAGTMSAALANRILANFDHVIKNVVENRRLVETDFRFEGTLKHYRCLNGNWALQVSLPKLRLGGVDVAPAGCNLRILAYASAVGDDSRARQKRDHWGDY